ncbi:MAG: hypothetical protein K2L89_01585, partial [Muribaculaceae bacterium]|nr:hypothetical protein [Muribaculaceae bacterium]
MDILRKELNSIYDAQKLNEEKLNLNEVERCKKIAESFTYISNGCSVITDASCDRCILFGASLGKLLGISDICPVVRVIDSSDEDVIYSLMHPEDLVEKRMLEYEFFKFINPLTASEKLNYQATCRLRLKTPQNAYILIDNTTQIICPSPKGKIWLI